MFCAMLTQILVNDHAYDQQSKSCRHALQTQQMSKKIGRDMCMSMVNNKMTGFVGCCESLRYILRYFRGKIHICHDSCTPQNPLFEWYRRNQSSQTLENIWGTSPECTEEAGMPCFTPTALWVFILVLRQLSLVYLVWALENSKFRWKNVKSLEKLKS